MYRVFGFGFGFVVVLRGSLLGFVLWLFCWFLVLVLLLLLFSRLLFFISRHVTGIFFSVPAYTGK